MVSKEGVVFVAKWLLERVCGYQVSQSGSAWGGEEEVVGVGEQRSRWAAGCVMQAIPGFGRHSRVWPPFPPLWNASVACESLI